MIKVNQIQSHANKENKHNEKAAMETAPYNEWKHLILKMAPFSVSCLYERKWRHNPSLQFVGLQLFPTTLQPDNPTSRLIGWIIYSINKVEFSASIFYSSLSHS